MKKITVFALLTFIVITPFAFALGANSGTNFSFSVGVVDKFFMTIPDWLTGLMFYGISGVISISVIYTGYFTALKFIERWSSFRTKIREEDYKRREYETGKGLDDLIKFAFNSPELNQEVLLRSEKLDEIGIARLQLFVKILECGTRYLDLGEKKFIKIVNPHAEFDLSEKPVENVIREFTQALKLWLDNETMVNEK